MAVESTSAKPKDKGGAPVGNDNALKNRPWREALARSLAQYSGNKVQSGQALRVIADRVVKSALDGDMGAIQEIANRLDGKPVQGVELTGADGAPVATVVTVQFVSPTQN